MTLSLEDKSVPKFTSNLNSMWENTLGIDMGLKDFSIASEGESVLISQYYRKSMKRLKTLQKSLSSSYLLACARQKKGSNRCLKALLAVAKQHKKFAEKRKYFHAYCCQRTFIEI